MKQSFLLLMLSVSAWAGVRPYSFVVTADAIASGRRQITFEIRDASGAVISASRTESFPASAGTKGIIETLQSFVEDKLALDWATLGSSWQGGEMAPHTHVAADITSGVLGCALQPALTGDVTTSGSSCAAVLANSGVVAGTYTKGTFDAKGRLTSGGNLVIGDLPSHRTGILFGSCSGTATSSSSLFLFPLGNSSALTCTVTAATSGIPIGSAGTLKNLSFKAGTGGKAGDLIAILKNGSTTGMPTCTFGTGTTCADISTSGAFVANDLITMRVTTTTSDTLANVQASVEVWQ